MSDQSGNMSRINMWKIKQKVHPKYEASVPVAKKDNNGNLICNKSELKKLYVEVYTDRLRHRKIQEEYNDLKENKEYLFGLRLKIASGRKSADWTMCDMNKVLKKLKTKKATDPVGIVNELFKPGVAGSDLVQSTLMLCNMMKK